MSWSLVNSNGIFDFKTFFGLRVRSVVGTGYPPQKLITTEYGLADGSLAQRIVFSERRIQLSGIIAAEKGASFPYKSYLQNRQFLIDQINRDVTVSDDGQGITPVTLRFTLDGKSIDIDVLYSSGLEMGPNEASTEEVTLEFLAQDPFWKSTTSISTSLTIPGPTIINSTATAKTFPTLIITGTGSVDSLVSNTSGLSISFTGLVCHPGEIITLDLRQGYKTLSSDDNGNLQAKIANGSDIATWALKNGDNSITLNASDAIWAQENGGALLFEDGTPIMLTSPENISASISYTPRHWSIDAVVNL
jgi:hypothetical protein